MPCWALFVGIVAPLIGIGSVSSSENGLGGLGDALAPAVVGLFIGFAAALTGAISAVAALVMAGKRVEHLGLGSIVGVVLSFGVFAIYVLATIEVLTW